MNDIYHGPFPPGHGKRGQMHLYPNEPLKEPQRPYENTVAMMLKDAFEQEQPKMSKDDVPENPPAFPNTGNSSWSMPPTEGMTLRDWFAGRALSAMELSRLNEGGFLCDAAVKGAYAYADAMLRARGVTATDGPRCAAKIGE